MSSSGRSPAKAPTTSSRVSGRASVAETTSSRKSTSASDGSGTSGTGPSTGSSVRPTYTVPSGCGSAITKRLVLPGTGAVTQTRRPGSDSPRSTRWLPRLGRRRTSARSPAHTPAAFTTIRAATSVSAPVSSSRSRTPVPSAASTRARVRMWAPYDAAVRAMVTTRRASSSSCPSQPEQPAAQAVDLEAGREGQRLGGGDVARAGERLAGGTGAEAEGVAGGERRPGERRLAAADVGVERHQHRERVRQVRGGRLHQDAPLDRALVGDRDLAVGEVAQPAVHQLGRPPRRAEREVVGVHGQHGQAAGDRVQGHPGPGHAEADDHEVDALGQVLGAGLNRLAG